jgi:cellulose 1,4-beta-cellobiosidase
LKLGFVTYGPYNKNVGSRMYMMADSDNYEMFKLKNREFTVDVDVSTLPCGVNGALYFVEMSANGDKGKGANSAGARYGTGYCDA